MKAFQPIQQRSLQAREAAPTASAVGPWLFSWFVAYLAAAVQLSAIIACEKAGLWPATVVIYVVPAAVTYWARRSARLSWWRLPAVFVLAEACVPTAAPLIFIVAQAWVLRRCWRVEAFDGDRRFSLRREPRKSRGYLATDLVVGGGGYTATTMTGRQSDAELRTDR